MVIHVLAFQSLNDEIVETGNRVLREFFYQFYLVVMKFDVGGGHGLILLNT